MRWLQMRISLLILNRNKKNICRLLCRRIIPHAWNNTRLKGKFEPVGQGNKPMAEELPLANHLRLMIEWKGNFQIAIANEIALKQLAEGAQSNFHDISKLLKENGAIKNTEYLFKFKNKSKLHLRHVLLSYSSCKALHNHSNKLFAFFISPVHKRKALTKNITFICKFLLDIQLNWQLHWQKWKKKLIRSQAFPKKLNLFFLSI